MEYKTVVYLAMKWVALMDERKARHWVALMKYETVV